MRLATLAAAGVAALVLASTASAGPYTLTSTATASGPTPFAGCTADNVALQESVQLKVQGVDGGGQYLIKRFRATRADKQVARVESVRQGGDGEFDVLRDEDFQGPVHAGEPAGVRVVD